MSNHSNSTEKTESCRTPSPRREVRWLDLGARNRSLESIKRCFQDRLDRFLSSSKSLLRRITSPVESKLRHNLHQCPGYLREEITLASDVSKSAIVSHSFPSQSEVCSICGQLVQYNRTEPSIVNDEKLEVPRYPSQNNFQNMASLSSLFSPMEDASNIRETYGYSASHSGSLTLDSVSCQWEDCIEVFTHLETLTHHIHNGKFLLVLGCMPSSQKLRSCGQYCWQTLRCVALLINILIVRLREISRYRPYWHKQFKLRMWMDNLCTARAAPNISFCIDIPPSITYWRKGTTNLSKPNDDAALVNDDARSGSPTCTGTLRVFLHP